MKKVISAAAAIIMASAMTVTAFAAPASENRDTVITTSIEPTYTIVVPGDTAVDFNTTTTDFGSVELKAAQIDPDYAVNVTLDASGTLKNSADPEKTIAYSVESEDGEYTGAAYHTAGDKTDLTINIAQGEWDAAFSGEYSDTVTFTIEYAAED